MVVFLKLILNRFFDANKEVQIIELKPQLQPQALESGQIDALFCLEPTGTLLEARGIGRAISINPLYEYIQQPFPTAAGIVSTSLAREHPEIISKIRAALRAAHDYIKTNPSEAALAVPKYAPIDADLAPRISVYDYWDIDAIDRNSVQQLADLYSKNGVLTKQVNTTALYATP
jgi:ABC-type nitrate/sulfonate/bicarbonate transport system substrate-binding protein